MNKIVLIFFLALTVFTAKGQDELLDLLNEETDEKKIASSVFKGTRLIHGHSSKLREKGELELLIAHRFGTINSGLYNLYGIDDAQMRIGFDYGLNDKINIGIGRSSVDKSYDGFIKVGILRQETGSNAMPFSLVGMANMYLRTTPSKEAAPQLTTSDRIAYSYSLLFSKKINSNLSIQIMPSLVHKNRVDAPDINDLFALGSGLRYKLTGSVSLNAEYYYRLNAPDDLPTFNSIAIGVDIETGGHVFQLHISNSRGMMERSFISETYGDPLEGDIHFGFNISRTFQLGKR